MPIHLLFGGEFQERQDILEYSIGCSDIGRFEIAEGHRIVRFGIKNEKNNSCLVIQKQWLQLAKNKAWTTVNAEFSVPDSNSSISMHIFNMITVIFYHFFSFLGRIEKAEEKHKDEKITSPLEPQNDAPIDGDGENVDWVKFIVYLKKNTDSDKNAMNYFVLLGLQRSVEAR